MSPNSNSGFTRSSIPAKTGSNIKANLSAVAIAAALATGNAYAEAEQQNESLAPIDGGSQVTKRVAVTKQGLENTLVAKATINTAA